MKALLPPLTLNLLAFFSTVTLTHAQLPVIIEQPRARTYIAGNGVELRVQVQSQEEVTYDWRRNGEPIDFLGFDSAVLSVNAFPDTFGGLPPADVIGNYTCVVTNSSGSVTSEIAVITQSDSSVFDRNNSLPFNSPAAFTVTIQPDHIGEAWRFQGEKLWRASGEKVINLGQGDRIIEFRPISGFIQPSPVSITLGDDDDLEINRTYFPASDASPTGSLRINLSPSSISDESLDEESQAQWRLLGLANEVKPAWLDSGDTITNLSPGIYLVECKPVDGRQTPATFEVTLKLDELNISETIVYDLPQVASGSLTPQAIPFQSVQTDSIFPYQSVGKIRSSIAEVSGFAVRDRVVLTVASALLKDAQNRDIPDNEFFSFCEIESFDFSYTFAENIQWLPQSDPAHKPVPLSPNGSIIYCGYADGRLSEEPGSFSRSSLRDNVIALYFEENAARDAYSGWLSSNSAPNEWGSSDAQKIIVGYPSQGVPADQLGRMFATTPNSATSTTLIDPLTPNLESDLNFTTYPGMIGGPVCISYINENHEEIYYPFGIYVGGVNEVLIRTFDEQASDEFTRNTLFDLIEIADDYAGPLGPGDITGGITRDSFFLADSIELPGVLSLIIEPIEAVEAGAGWRIGSEGEFRASGSILAGVTPGRYSIEFAPVAGYPDPQPLDIVISPGENQSLTFNYNNDPIADWRNNNFHSPENSGDGADENDPDGDGQNNRSEFIAGTNPNDPQDVLVAETVSRNGNRIELMVTGKTNRIYRLQKWTPQPNQDAPQWETVVTLPELQTGQMNLSLVDPSTKEAKTLYRVSVLYRP